MTKKSPQHYLDIMKEIAEENGGKLLSTKWKGSLVKYEFENKDGVKFFRNYTTLLRHGWVKLFIFSNDQYLEELRTIAKSREGFLISNEYKGRNNPLEFKDKNGQSFLCSPRSIKNGGWLSNRVLVSEQICRQVLEYMFGYQFPKTKKVLTKQITNRKAPLELDGYCKELNIAFEYQGDSSHWNVNDKDYIETNKRDLLKAHFCEVLKIPLIVIPKFKEGAKKWDSQLVFEIILNIVNDTFKKNEVIIEYKTESQKFSVDFSTIDHVKTNINHLIEIAKKHEGELISKDWHGVAHPYEFKSKDGFLFTMSLKNYRINGWPQNIEKYNNLKKGHRKTNEELLEEIRFIAEKNNCKLLSNEWKGNTQLYLFQSKNGEEFLRTAQDIKRANWPQKYT